MSDNSEYVTLSDDQIEECERWAHEVVAHYRRGEDREACLPWSLDGFTPDYLREWLASRKEAGRKIDIETCEVGWWYACGHDPYGLEPDEVDGLGRHRYVRSPKSRGWISENDLPPAKARAMYDRIERKWRARQN
jgi:hypothetical protein